MPYILSNHSHRGIQETLPCVKLTSRINTNIYKINHKLINTSKTARVKKSYGFLPFLSFLDKVSTKEGSLKRESIQNYFLQFYII